MLLDKLVAEIERCFPNLEYSTDAENKEIMIPSGSAVIGNICITDDIHELSVFVGNFSHWHSSSTDPDNATSIIVEQVVEFLRDLFQDKIVMWGSSESYGGFYSTELDEAHQDTPLESESVRKYLWSGREVS